MENIICTLRVLFVCSLFFKLRKSCRLACILGALHKALFGLTADPMWCTEHLAAGREFSAVSLCYVHRRKGGFYLTAQAVVLHIPFLVRGTHQSDCGLISYHSCHLGLVTAQGWFYPTHECEFLLRHLPHPPNSALRKAYWVLSALSGLSCLVWLRDPRQRNIKKKPLWAFLRAHGFPPQIPIFQVSLKLVILSLPQDMGMVVCCPCFTKSQS